MHRRTGAIRGGRQIRVKLVRFHILDCCCACFDFLRVKFAFRKSPCRVPTGENPYPRRHGASDVRTDRTSVASMRFSTPHPVMARSKNGAKTLEMSWLGTGREASLVIWTQARPLQSTRSLPRFSLRPCVSCLASSFDERKESNRRGLNACCVSVYVGGSSRRKVDARESRATVVAPARSANAIHVGKGSRGGHCPAVDAVPTRDVRSVRTSPEALERLTVERKTTLRGRFGESHSQEAERAGGRTADLSLALM